MKYVKMSIEEANKFIGKNGIVLVAVQDLEKDEVAEFQKKKSNECQKIIESAETIARVYDDFINQLRIYTHKQIDIVNIERRGKLSTILLKE